MKWNKLGFVFDASCVLDGFRGAAVPQAIHLHDDVFRVFYSPRDIHNRSYVFWVDIDVIKLRIVDYATEPALCPGELGAFDDSGTMMSFVGQFNGEWRLYYIGWNLGKTVPFRNSIGLAISKDGKHFERLFKGPIIDRNKTEPHFCASNWVIKEDKYRMWYLSCTGWRITEDGEIQHRYHIKYCESADGIDWDRDGIVCIDYKDETEYAISRPTVLKKDGQYHMWFSHRGDKYRIGYATSDDGIVWNRRDDKAGIDISEDSFDSEMICYPAVFEHKDRLYMLFNGNRYGMTGFGIARMAEE